MQESLTINAMHAYPLSKAKEEDFIKATQRIYRSKEHPTHLKVGVLKQ